MGRERILAGNPGDERIHKNGVKENSEKRMAVKSHGSKIKKRETREWDKSKFLLFTSDKVKLRINNVKKLGEHWPTSAKLLFNHYLENAKLNGLEHLGFAVPELPLSVNHQKMFRNSNKLKPEVWEFRKKVKAAVEATGKKWIPTGITAAIIFLECPGWTTKKFTPREMDADNRIKPTFDAAEMATGIPDELHWEFHVYKIPSRRKRTLVYLFDLGDIVEYYQS